MGMAGKNGEISGNSALEDSYRLKFVTQEQKPIAGIPQEGKLTVKRSSNLGYELLGKQNNQFLKINGQGFRDSQELPLLKPKGEKRIFILGNSTAFGQGLGNNEQAISHKLEYLLQERQKMQQKAPEKFRPDVFPFFKPDREKLFKLPAKVRPGNYRVINAGVPGYTMGNSLAQTTLDILPYQPDVIIFLGGYTDLLLPSQQAQADVPKIDEFLGNAQAHFKSAFDLSLSHWFDRIYLVKAFNYLTFKPQPSLAKDNLSLTGGNLVPTLPKNAQELQKRINRYQEQQKQLVQLAASLNIPVIIAFQPEITARPAPQRSASEKAIAQSLGKTYLEKMPDAYNQLIKAGTTLAQAYPGQVKVRNFYQLTPQLPPNAFKDPIHLSEAGNKVIAIDLYQTLSNWEKMQIIPENFYLKD
jgi:lysophospholipase L1-like esterase